MSPLSEVCRLHSVKIESICTDGSVLPSNFKDSVPYISVLTHQGRKIIVPFYMGKGHVRTIGGKVAYIAGKVQYLSPSAADVISSLLCDASCSSSSFSDFCANMGMDEDSRSGKKLYRACKKSSEKIHYLLGDDFDEFVNAEH